jgi:hypothetical protein
MKIEHMHIHKVVAAVAITLMFILPGATTFANKNEQRPFGPLPESGSIVAWGDNSYGQCDVPSPNSGFTTIAAGFYHSLGLKADGSIRAWGWNNWGQCDVPSPNSGFTAIAAGEYHSLGLKADSSIIAWGDNEEGQCTVPLPNGGFTAVAADGGHSLGLKADGSIVAWGYNGDGECDVPSPNSGFTAIAAGAMHSLGLKADGSIVAWGYNYYGQCDVPSPNSGFTAIAAGEYYSLGLKVNNSIIAWGYNGDGECDVPSPNSGFTAIATNWCHSLGLKADGSIVAWGDNSYGQCDVPSPNSGFTAIAAGAMHSLGLKAETPPQGDLVPTDIKIIQVTDNATELIVDKSSITCVNITSTYPSPVKANINVTYNYSRQTYTETGPNGNGVSLNPGWNLVYIPGGPVIHQNGAMNQSWIPAGTGPWLKWDRAGTDTQVKTVVGHNQYPSPGNHIDINIVNTRSISIENYRIIPTPPATYHAPTLVDFQTTITQGGYFLRSTYPVAENKFTNTNNDDYQGDITPLLGLYADMETLNIITIIDQVSRAVGIVTDDYFTYHLQKSGTTGLHWKGAPNAVLVAANYWTVLAHEIGHTYGLCLNQEDYTLHPYPPWIGSPANGTWCDRREIITNGYSFMGYAANPNSFLLTCIDGEGNVVNRHAWVNATHYNYLLNQLRQTKQRAENQTIMYIWAVLDRNDTIDLRNIYVFQNQSLNVPQQPGNYSIQLLNIANETIDEFSFDPLFEINADPYGTIETNCSGFCYSLPYHEGVRKILVKHGNVTIAERLVSDHAPTLNLIHPNGGETIEIGKKYNITWNANDVDGNTLYYTITYSSDNGKTFSLLQFESTKNYYLWDTTGLTPGTEYKIQIIANDGYHTVIDESNSTFTLTYPSAILIGLISKVNESDTYLTFNANLLFWLSFKPFNLHLYSSQEAIEVLKPYRGIISEPFIIGKFSTAVLSGTTGSYHPLRDRPKHLLAPHPRFTK